MAYERHCHNLTVKEEKYIDYNYISKGLGLLLIC